ncbi:response regulator [Paenibacillus alginolyticus]|uniref:response regulator n=1 Tax=Paenibacillus alginolyticus TaxID=59839 RepID=UPI0004160585|nr:response regulator [Paenibacillus alginolyticus]MCY9663942.1 response regulator [Paenibacillus alginolyticus]
MFRVVIVEDEKPILELMKVIIGRNPHCTIVGTFSNPLEAVSSLPELRPDIAFLDVEMPRMNGLELAMKLNERQGHTKIVFTTAYKEYALEAFQVYAFDYILKPVTPASIERITNRLLKLMRPADQTEQMEQQIRHASIRCFGGFEVKNPDGVLVHWPTRKTEELFAFFLCHPRQNVSKWHLADILWPDMLEDRASHNLHNTIYRLKKLMKEQEIGMDIVKTNEGYMLDTQDVRYDLLEFQSCEAVQADGKQDVAQADRLFAMYRGTLLERKDFLWKSKLEEGYAKQYTALVRGLVGRDVAAQEWGKAEQKLDMYLSIVPLNEEMNQLLMDVYASSGRRERIVKHYASFEELYRRELGIEPPKEMSAKAAAYVETGN